MKASTPARLARLPSVATTLGLGGGPLGGLFSPVTPETAESVVERAWDHGLRLFDVAPLYGHGRAELRLQSLRGAAFEAELPKELWEELLEVEQHG